MMHFIAPTVGIDLGSSNTLIYVKKKGIVVSEPTLVVVSSDHRKQYYSFGRDAMSQLGRTNASRTVIWPIRNGAIVDFDMTVLLLRHLLRRAIGTSNVVGPTAVVSVPAGLDNVNRKAITEAIHLSGVRKVYLIEKPFASALGSMLPAYDPIGSMVVDIGGGTTDVAVVSLGGLVVSQSIPVGGTKMDEAIINHIKREFSMLISDKTAEDVKIDLASALPLTVDRSVRIRGRDLLSPQPMDIEYTARQAQGALREPCRAIVSAIRWVLERTPPELAADVMRTGIHLTGGGAQLNAIDQYIATDLDIPVLIAKEPGDCTVLGLANIVENLDMLSQQGRLPEEV